MGNHHLGTVRVLGTKSARFLINRNSKSRSVGFTTECFGFHIGNPQTANLGDGRGWVNETGVLRYDYDNAFAGSCLESLTGIHHFCIFGSD